MDNINLSHSKYIFTISEKIYNEILKNGDGLIRYVNDIYTDIEDKKRWSYFIYISDKTNKSNIREVNICIRKQYLSIFFENRKFSGNDFTPYVLRVDFNQTKDWVDDITGLTAYIEINKKLKKKGLTMDDIHNRLSSYDTKSIMPKHEQWYESSKFYNIKMAIKQNESFGIAFRIPNCVYYDINKAHSEALSIIFPEIAEELNKMAILSKTNKILKKYPNYYVGWIKHIGYDGAYYWVVKHTREKAEEFYKKVGGTIVYFNTDGFIVSNPKKIIPSSDKLGEFKIEYQGDVYVAKTQRGWYIQYGDELKSNTAVLTRELVNLKEGKVVDYKIVQHDHYNEYKDIEIKNIEVIDYE